jgi:hypothetical protein
VKRVIVSTLVVAGVTAGLIMVHRQQGKSTSLAATPVPTTLPGILSVPGIPIGFRIVTPTPSPVPLDQLPVQPTPLPPTPSPVVVGPVRLAPIDATPNWAPNLGAEPATPAPH